MTVPGGDRDDATVSFGILGPLEITVSGRPVRVGGPRARGVLATLLMARGDPVSAGELESTVWGPRPPASVRSQVLMAVSVLRRTLRQAGCARQVIDTTDSGYRLRATEIEVDAWSAEAMIRVGRTASGNGDTAHAASVLRTALDLWRGPALSGLHDSTRLRWAAGHWDELRLAAAEEWAELELALGRHRTLIGALTGHVAEAPLSESLRGRLMLALYRSGRRADALDVYRAGRTVLTDTAGIDPGPELRRLHAAILADDPALAAAPASPRVAGRCFP